MAASLHLNVWLMKFVCVCTFLLAALQSVLYICAKSVCCVHSLLFKCVCECTFNLSFCVFMCGCHLSPQHLLLLESLARLPVFHSEPGKCYVIRPSSMDAVCLSVCVRVCGWVLAIHLQGICSPLCFNRWQIRTWQTDAECLRDAADAPLGEPETHACEDNSSVFPSICLSFPKELSQIFFFFDDNL